jgi:hypothetical protein
LERVFEEEEVMGVVKAMNGDKAPRPYDISMAFFQACWDVLKEDIMKGNERIIYSVYGGK